MLPRTIHRKETYPMGFLSRLFKPRQQPEAPFAAGNPLAPLAGTTTSRLREAQAVMERQGQTAVGFLETTGMLVREDSDERQEESVAVSVDGTTIGYLWTVRIDALALESFKRPVPVQIFSDVIDGDVRIEAWAWLAPTTPAWEWSAHNRPPMTTEGKAAQRTADTRQMLQGQAARSPTQAQQIADGSVDGVHYLELVEPIKQAKREGGNEEALRPSYPAIGGAERGRQGREPAPAYTQHAAIILRKLRRPDEEAAVLERYLQWLPDGAREGHEFAERLTKVRDLQQRAQG